jgi:predicted transcriptional regulator
MCHFITAVIGSKAGIERLNAIAQRHHRFLTPVENESLRPYLKANERYYSTLRRNAFCDCGTSLGWYAREQRRAPKPVDIEIETRRLVRKGWGKAKIARWLEARDRSHWVPTSEETLAIDRRNDDWLALAEGFLADSSVSAFCLLLHWYRGRLDSRIPSMKANEWP